MNKYDEILSLPHHVSPTRPQMPRADRAAQFAPFAALTGYEEVIDETARVTQQRPELDEARLERGGAHHLLSGGRNKAGRAHLHSHGAHCKGGCGGAQAHSRRRHFHRFL